MVVEKLSALLSGSPVATVAVDLGYKVVWQNDAFSHRFLCHDALRDILTLEFKIRPADADTFLASDDACELTTKLDHIYRIKKYTFIENSICVVSFESAPQSEMAEFNNTFFAKVFAGSQEPVIVFSHDSLSISYFNRPFAETVGLPSIYIANAPKSKFYAESFTLLKYLEVGESSKFDTTSMALNGEIVFLEVLLTLVAVNGENVLILKAADVTRKRITKVDNTVGFPFFPFEKHMQGDAMLVSENGVIVDANKRACAVWGYSSPEEMVGKHIEGLVKKEYANKFNCGSKDEWLPFIGVDKDGAFFKAEKNNKVLVRSNKTLHVTLVRVLQFGEQWQNTSFNTDLLDAQPNPVIIYNSSTGDIVKCNQCLLNLFQCVDTNEFKDKYVDISQLFIEEDAFMSVAKHGTDWYMAPYRNSRKEYLIKLCGSDGEPRIFSVLTNVIDSFGVEHAVVSLTDVTETVQQNYILMDVNSMLKDQYDDIQLALTDNMATLIQQSKLATMGEMIGVISHQWKQPLNTIGLIAQNVEDMVDDTSDPISHQEIASMMKSIMKHVLFMSETVDNFRDFFRKNTQRLFFPITNAIDSTLNLVSPVLGKSRVVVEKEYPDNHTSLLLFGFPNDFKQVLMNVLINGTESINAKIKNGQAEDGSGKIVIRIAKTHKYEATLTIIDNGTGLSGEVSENIFKMNFTTKGEAGTGLGLYMSKKIIDSLGGEVSVQNHADGVEFLMRLPIIDRSLPKRR